MGNPKVIAAASAVAALFLGYSIFGPADEAPSTALKTMNWIFFLMAVVAFVGSMLQIIKGERT